MGEMKPSNHEYPAYIGTVVDISLKMKPQDTLGVWKSSIGHKSISKLGTTVPNLKRKGVTTCPIIGALDLASHPPRWAGM